MFQLRVFQMISKAQKVGTNLSRVCVLAESRRRAASQELAYE